MIALLLIALWGVLGLAVSQLIMEYFGDDADEWSNRTMFWVIVALGPMFWFIVLYEVTGANDE